jgi:2-polyprenyl-3-methyl-5-hydroxy-6-metoxy-1,4-benzoquinol methylase
VTEQRDFEEFYRTEIPPWDTKAPKENVIAWQAAGLVHGEVLDIGCGLGDNAIYLAQHGHAVTGLDIAPTALNTATQRATDAGVAVRFAVTDATSLDGYVGAFDTVVDSGCYHCLDDSGRAAYAVAVHRATRPGATLLLSAFSDANAARGEWPRPMVSEAQLRQTLGEAGWTVLSLESVTVPLEAEGADAEMWMLTARR